MSTRLVRKANGSTGWPTHGALLGLALAASGCSADLTEAWDVKEPRLYGMRVEVEGDPGRSTPTPGESFRLYPQLVLPKELSGPRESLYDLALGLCLGVVAPDGTLVCAAELPLSSQFTTVSQLELVTSPISVPDFDALLAGVDPEIAKELKDITQFVVFGALCVEGKVERVEGKSIMEVTPFEL
jgi:hypothetical protein